MKEEERAALAARLKQIKTLKIMAKKTKQQNAENELEEEELGKQILQLKLSFHEMKDDKFTVKVTCEKDGKESDLNILTDDDSIGMVYQGMKIALGTVARFYLMSLLNQGTITQEEYDKMVSK